MSSNISGINDPLLNPNLAASSSSSSSASPFANDTIGGATGSSGGMQALSPNVPVLSPPNPFTAEITLNKYLSIMNASKLKLQDAMVNYANAIRQSDLQLAGALGASKISSLLAKNALTSLFNKETTLFRQELSESLSYNVNSVDPYNSFLNSASDFTSKMYEIQQQFAAGTITSAEYNAAVDAWNAEVDAKNAELQAQYDAYSAATAAYNLQVKENNIEIKEINDLRKAAGIKDLIPLQEPATLGSLTLFPTNLPHDPNPKSLPTVSSSLPTVSETSEDTGMSVEIDVPNLSHPEQALLDSISEGLQQINQGSAEAYNKALIATESQVAAMKKAISDFSQGLIDQATYDAAVNTYVAYATTANTQLNTLAIAYRTDVINYNNTLNDINTKIINFNKSRPANQQIPLQFPLAVPPLNSDGEVAAMLLPTSIPSGPSPPATNPFDTAPGVLLPSVPTGSTTPGTLAAYLAKYFQATFSTTFQEVLLSFILLNNQRNAEFWLEFLTGKSRFSPYNAPEAQPNLFVNEKGAAPGISGVGLTMLIAGIHNSALTSIIARQLLLATGNLLEGKKLPSGVSEKALAFALSALQEALLSAGHKAGSLLSKFPSTLFEGSEAVATALSATLATEVSALINSGAVKNAIVAYLTEAGLSPAEIATVQDALTAGVTLGLLQFTVLQVANLLNLPGLLPQVLGNLPNATPNFQQQILSTLTNRAETVLGNQASVAALKSVLTENANASTRAQIERAVDAAARERANFNTLSDLQNAIADNLNKQNFDVPTANELALRAANFVRDEQSLTNLDEVYAKDSFESSLRASQDVKDAVARAQENNYETNRQFRGALVKEFQNQGKGIAEAYDLANDVLQSQLARTEENRAIGNSAALTSALNNQQLLQSTLSRDIIQSSINQSAINQRAVNQENVNNAEFNRALSAQGAVSSNLNAQALNESLNAQAAFSHDLNVQATNQSLERQAALNAQALASAVNAQPPLDQAREPLGAQVALNAQTLNRAPNAPPTNAPAETQAAPNAQALNQAIGAPAAQQVQANPPSQQDIANALALTELEKTRRESQALFIAALNATTVQKPTSEQKFNTTLIAELTARGVDQSVAEEFARRAIATINHEGLKSAVVSDFLDRDTLRNQLISEVTTKLQGVLNAPLANQLADQIATVIVGPVVAAERKEETIQRTNSILELLNAAHVDSQIAYTEKTRDQQIENYRIFITQFTNPSTQLAVNLKTFFERMMDPANSLLYVSGTGIMYAGMGRKPSNYKESIDILV